MYNSFYKVFISFFVLFYSAISFATVTPQRLGKILLGNNYTVITNSYNPPGHVGYTPPSHLGIDFRARTPLPVYSPVNGIVTASNSNWGHLAIRIEGTNIHFIFLHLSRIDYSVGESVSSGSQIGLSGDVKYNSSPITAAHLHVEARNGRSNPADPNSAASSQHNLNPSSVVTESCFSFYGAYAKQPANYDEFRTRFSIRNNCSSAQQIQDIAISFHNKDNGNFIETCYRKNSGFSLAAGASRSTGLQACNKSNPTLKNGTYKLVYKAKYGGTFYDVLTKEVRIGKDITPILSLLLFDDKPTPQIIGSINTPGSARSVFVSGSYAYVADTSSGLQIVNISNPTNPNIVGSVDTIFAKSVYVNGNYAYVADASSGLQIVNISNPTNPNIVGSVDTPNFATGVYVNGNYAYVADTSSGLQIVNISNPTNPNIVGSVDTPGFTDGVFVSGNYAYVADYSSGLQIVNISNPTNPNIVGSVDTPNNAASDVFVSGNYAYVADSDSGLQIIDISSL